MTNNGIAEVCMNFSIKGTKVTIDLEDPQFQEQLRKLDSDEKTFVTPYYDEDYPTDDVFIFVYRRQKK